jgi:hypothetical protein
MSALAADPVPDPLDPAGILHDLPEEERASFLEEYRRRLSAAADPAGWKLVLRLLRVYRGHIEDMKNPDYWEAVAAAQAPAGAGGFWPELEDRIREEIERRQSA